MLSTTGKFQDNKTTTTGTMAEIYKKQQAICVGTRQRWIAENDATPDGYEKMICAV
jgi:hypothetical protein